MTDPRKDVYVDVDQAWRDEIVGRINYVCPCRVDLLSDFSDYPIFESDIERFVDALTGIDECSA